MAGQSGLACFVVEAGQLQTADVVHGHGSFPGALTHAAETACRDYPSIVRKYLYLAFQHHRQQGERVTCEGFGSFKVNLIQHGETEKWGGRVGK
jgi:hypothetical protein